MTEYSTKSGLLVGNKGKNGKGEMPGMDRERKVREGRQKDRKEVKDLCINECKKEDRKEWRSNKKQEGKNGKG